MFREILDELALGGRVVVLVHRTMLLEQLAKDMTAFGIDFGIISTEHAPDESKRVQLCMAQTLAARAINSSRIKLPKATKVLVDEWHQQTGKTLRSLVYGTQLGNVITEGWKAEGATVQGYTATPIVKEELARHMVIVGSYSEMREANMHLPIEVYGPDEIDTSKLKANAAGEYSEKALTKASHLIFGSVYQEWKNRNKDALPALLFGPSVDASKWFAYTFAQKGVRVAHMDASQCIFPDGDSCKLAQYPSDRETREHVLQLSKTGQIAMVCNRFLLREAIDMPWLYHGIFATVFGSLNSALQSVGRLQRYWPDYTHKLLQDHGGFVWRHGHPDEDRTWALGKLAKEYREERIKKLHSGELHEGIRCPKCGYWRRGGPVCLNSECRHAHPTSVRIVMSLTGKLKKIEGSVHKAPTAKEQAQKLWNSTLFSSGPKGRSVSSAVAIFNTKCEAAGLVVDWAELRHRPPMADSQEWHLTVAAYYPWTVNRKPRKPKVAT